MECASLRRWMPSLDPGLCGRFALVHERVLVGVYESEAEAVAKGFETFGAVPFLVRQIPPTAGAPSAAPRGRRRDRP